MLIYVWENVGFLNHLFYKVKARVPCIRRCCLCGIDMVALLVLSLSKASLLVVAVLRQLVGGVGLQASLLVVLALRQGCWRCWP